MNAFSFGCWYNTVNYLITSDLTLSLFRIWNVVLEGCLFLVALYPMD